MIHHDVSHSSICVNFTLPSYHLAGIDIEHLNELLDAETYVTINYPIQYFMQQKTESQAASILIHSA